VCVLINPADAGTLAVSGDDQVEIIHLPEPELLKVPIRIDETMPASLLGVAAGLPPFRNLPNGARVALKKAEPEPPAKTGGRP
jgi:hypothetical protein